MLAGNQIFRSVYCQRYQCRPERFNTHVFRRCFYLHALPVALPLRLLYPRFFQPESNLIEEAGNSQNLREIRMAIDEYRDVCRLSGSFVRKYLRMRISGQKMAALASKLL